MLVLGRVEQFVQVRARQSVVGTGLAAAALLIRIDNEWLF